MKGGKIGGLKIKEFHQHKKYRKNITVKQIYGIWKVRFIFFPLLFPLTVENLQKLAKSTLIGSTNTLIGLGF